MCLGAIGDAVQSLDKVISGPLLDPMKKATQWLTDNTVGKLRSLGGDAASLFDKVTNHPLESAAVAAASYYSFGAADAALGAGAGAAAEGGAAAAEAGTAGAALTAAGDSAAADSGAVNLFADAVPGAGGDVGATVGGAGNGAATAGAGSSSSWLDYAKTTGKVLAPTVVSSLLAPKPPKAQAPTAMPDPLAQQQATQQKLLQQLARRGRASTILTSPGDGGGSLGG